MHFPPPINTSIADVETDVFQCILFSMIEKKMFALKDGFLF